MISKEIQISGGFTANISTVQNADIDVPGDLVSVHLLIYKDTDAHAAKTQIEARSITLSGAAAIMQGENSIADKLEKALIADASYSGGTQV